jgi:two-component system, cell cycle response regulator DivK
MARQAAQIHVLVVDDDQDCREMFSTYLTYVGCNVRTAEDGRDAIDAVTHWAPDVIVMDLSMPNVDGWTASKRLKASPATRGIPIIALSAIQMGREGARAAGCDAYLAKPCLPDLLWWEIRALLEPHA